MSIRMNAGYIIIGSIPVENVEFVLGVSSSNPSRFVTWECRNGTDYYWGHYMVDKLSAVQDLLERARRELEAQMQDHSSAHKVKTKKEHER